MFGRNFFNKFTYLFFLSLLIFSFIGAGQVSADNQVPTFPTCSNPQGSITAYYDNGIHGIPGDQSTYTGTDTVYSLSNGNAMQCFCGSNGNGTQTNWWNAGNTSSSTVSYYEHMGWIFIPTGANWGLTNNQYLAQNSSYSCSNGGNGGNSSNGGGGSSSPSNPHTNTTSAPVCTMPVPTAPTLLSAIDPNYWVNLSWTKASGPVTYYLIGYGTKSGDYIFGNPNVGDQNTTSYTVRALSPNTTYYFVIRAVNGCMPGPWSNEVAVTINGGGMASQHAAGFSTHVPGLNAPVLSPVLVNSMRTDRLTCANLVWLPIILLETTLILLIYSLIYRQTLKLTFKQTWGVNAGIMVIGYFLFLFINRNCISGSMNYIIFSIPGSYFWMTSGIVYVVENILFRKLFQSSLIKNYTK